MYNFQSLTKKDWVTDYGFRKALEANPGTMTFGGQPVARDRRDIVDYWQREKSHYPLWELLCYIGSYTAPRRWPTSTCRQLRGVRALGVQRRFP